MNAQIKLQQLLGLPQLKLASTEPFIPLKKLKVSNERASNSNWFHDPTLLNSAFQGVSSSLSWAEDALIVYYFYDLITI